MKLDETDLQIIALLKESPRSTNRLLARALALSEPNIAARVSRLEESGVLRVLAVVDMHAVGYEHVVVFCIRVADRHPDAVAAEISSLPEVMGVNSTFGRFQLVSLMLARDKAHLSDLLDQQIGTIEGVQDLEACLVLDVHLMRLDAGTLSVFDDLNLRQLPLEETGLDELDVGIITVLQENGRSSFREIGRRLSTPEATVRSRISKLEQMRVIKLFAVTDTDSLIPEKASAWIALRVRGGTLNAAATRLREVADTGFVATTMGRYNLLALLVLPTRRDLHNLVSEEIAPLNGVQQVEVWEIVRSYKHDIRIATKFT